MDDYGHSKIIDDVAPANAGRGSINPPLATDIQPQVIKRGTRVTPGMYSGPDTNTLTIGDIVEPVAAATIGAAKGATAGLFPYLPTAFQYAGNRLIGKHPEFKKLLSENRSAIKTLEERNPIASTIGDVGGSASLGVLTGGSSLPVTIGSQAAQGGVRAYADSPDATLTDAAKAAAVSGALTGTIGLTGKALKYAADEAKAVFSNNFLEKIRAQSAKIGRDLTPSESQKLFEETSKHLEATSMVKSLPKAVWNEVKSAILPATTGAIAGATTAAVSGQDPWTGAKYGAAGVVGATKLKVLEKAGNTVASVVGRPLLAKEPLIEKATKYAVPAISGATQPGSQAVLKNINTPEVTDDYGHSTVIE